MYIKHFFLKGPAADGTVKGQEVQEDHEDWTDRLSRNVGTELPLNAA